MAISFAERPCRPTVSISLLCWGSLSLSLNGHAKDAWGWLCFLVLPAEHQTALGCMHSHVLGRGHGPTPILDDWNLFTEKILTDLFRTSAVEFNNPRKIPRLAIIQSELAFIRNRSPLEKNKESEETLDQ